MSNRLHLLIILLGLTSCFASTKDATTFRHFLTYAEDTGNKRFELIKEKARNFKLPQPVVHSELLDAWEFRINKSQRPDSDVVNIPHRFDIPNCEAWYYKDFYLPFPSVLQIHSDDGAQLFVDGKPILRTAGNFFFIADSGNLRLGIRVMNNAMSGGLTRVALIRDSDFNQYNSECETYRRIQNLVEKAVLLNVSNSSFTEKVMLVLDKPSEKNISDAESEIRLLPLLIGPTITYIDSTQVYIHVISEYTCLLELAWGSDRTGLNNTIAQTDKNVTFKITKLQPGMTYYYRIRANKTTSEIFSFKVPSNDDQSFTFDVWADSQSGLEHFDRHIRNTSLHSDAFGIGVGDLVADGSSENEWMSFLKSLSWSASQIPYFLIPGNHDYDGFYDSLKPNLFLRYTDYQPETYYAWQYKNCAFIALDPNETFPIGISSGSKQHVWLMNTLQSEWWANSAWKFILIHQPPFSQGWTNYHGDIVIRELLEPLFEKYKIDFVVSGHTHDYERLTRKYGNQNTTFLIVGGAGGTLESAESSSYPKMDTVIKDHHIGRFTVERNQIQFKVYDTNNRVIDSIEVLKQFTPEKKQD